MVKNTIKTEQIAYKILIEPWITEEATRVAELNKYIFKVASEADKRQIREAVEGLYGVKVISVNIINIPGKKRTRGRTTGWKSGYKKAIITLKEGNKIEFFENK
jgi:large subunit ribosomal protein L23